MMTHETCATCAFWKPSEWRILRDKRDEVRPVEMPRLSHQKDPFFSGQTFRSGTWKEMEFRSRRVELYGICRRYPENAYRYERHSCGEWRRKAANERIELSEVSARTRNVLKGLAVERWRDLGRLTRHEVETARHVGRTTMREIEKHMREAGVTFWTEGGEA